MVRKEAFLNGGISTCTAYEGLVPRLVPHVGPESAALLRAVGLCAALTRAAVVTVDSSVPLEMGRVGRAVLAKLASKRLLSCVPHEVPLQVVPSHRNVPAQLTLVRTVVLAFDFN